MKIFNKIVNKTDVANATDDENDNDNQNKQPTNGIVDSIKNTIATKRANIVNTATALKEKAIVEKQKFEHRQYVLFLVWNILSAVFYTVSAFVSIANNWSSTLSHVVLAVTVVYVLVFLVILIKDSKQKLQTKENLTQYRSGMKLMKIILNVIDTTIALLVLLNTLQLENIFSDPRSTIIALLSAMWLSFKIVTYFVKFIRWLILRKKHQRKRERMLAKAQEKKFDVKKTT